MGLATCGVALAGTGTDTVRPSCSANVNASAMLLIGPAGTPDRCECLVPVVGAAGLQDRAECFGEDIAIVDPLRVGREPGVVGQPWQIHGLG